MIKEDKRIKMVENKEALLRENGKNGLYEKMADKRGTKVDHGNGHVG